MRVVLHLACSRGPSFPRQVRACPLTFEFEPLTHHTPTSRHLASIPRRRQNHPPARTTAMPPKKAAASSAPVVASPPASVAADADASFDFLPAQSSKQLTQANALTFMIRAIYQYLSQFGLEEVAARQKQTTPAARPATGGRVLPLLIRLCVRCCPSAPSARVSRPEDRVRLSLQL